jgi:hypothetical protein
VHACTLCVCVCVRAFTPMLRLVCTHVRVCERARTYVYASVCAVHVRVCTCVCLRVYLCTSVCEHMCARAWGCVRARLRVCICAFITTSAPASSLPWKPCSFHTLKTCCLQVVHFLASWITKINREYFMNMACAHVYMCLFACESVCVSVCVSMCVSVCVVHVCGSVRRVCVDTHLRLRIQVRALACACVCLCVCAHVCACMPVREYGCLHCLSVYMCPVCA